MTTSAARLCLNMIVKNEAANIERCLRAVADCISFWVIGDTGSTDGTQDLIRNFFADRSIPGELHSFPFETFDQARNAALGFAEASPLPFDYILFADADMQLVVSEADFARHLTADVYMVRQDSGVVYWNARLLRRGAPARYVGVTHEYLNLEKGETRQLEGIAYLDHASGANRGGKFTRDAALLSRALETERDPGLRARYTFYLANSLRDGGDHAGALARFLERARLGHWQEEVFVSLLNAAQMKAVLGHPADDVIAAFEAAHEACPTRAEALHGAARFCREKSLHERGYRLAARGRGIVPPASGLFVAEWVYRYGLLDELAVNAYWSGHHAECVAACEQLLAEPSLPADHRDRVVKNRQFAWDRLREAEIARAAAPKRVEGAGPAIPQIFHFITGLDKGFGGKPFSFVHAMAILSALRVNEGFVARVYYEYEPDGPYWEFVKRQVTCVPIVAPREFCGHPVEHFANRADIVRLKTLIEHGGVYLDMDTICQKPFAPLLDGSVVMGLEKTSDGSTIGLCNATVIAPPGAPFLELWLDSYNDFTMWNRFAVQLPMQIAAEHPHLIRIEPNTSFFWPPWDEAGIAALFTKDGSFPEAYSFHLWESKSWDHLKRLDANRVGAVDTTYNRVARRFVSADWPGAEGIASPVSALEPAEMEDAARRAVESALSSFWHRHALQRRLDVQMEAYWAAKRDRSSNPLVKAGEKYFSQSDEDGITLEICRRIGLEGGCVLEFGVGDGLENNSLILLLGGWRAVWIGNEDLSIHIPPGCRNLTFSKAWVTAENAATLVADALGADGLGAVNLLSIDLDGNDIYVLERLLATGLRPDVVIVEYNGKFPPPIRWRVGYDAGYRWDGSDYQGASLQAFADVLSARDYRLVCCALTGVNAFFIRRDHADRFADVPDTIETLFYPADYNWFVRRGHGVSKRTIEAALVT